MLDCVKCKNSYIVLININRNSEFVLWLIFFIFVYSRQTDELKSKYQYFFPAANLFPKILWLPVKLSFMFQILLRPEQSTLMRFARSIYDEFH